MSKRAAAGLVVAVIVVALAGCGSSARGTGQIRTPPMILTCLRGEHVSADTMFPLGHMNPGKGLVAPEALVVIDHGASLTGQIVVYRNRVAAASAFARGGRTMPNCWTETRSSSWPPSPCRQAQPR